MKWLLLVNLILGVIFVLCYGYQLAYILVAYLKKDKPLPPPKDNRIGVLICARNEEKVIPRLIRTLKAQTYDSSRYEIFLAADNCTDSTANVARERGITALEFEGDRYDMGSKVGFLKANVVRGLENDETREEFGEFLRELIGKI